MAVYSWGLGKSGQLGTGTTDKCHTPQRVKCGHLIGRGSSEICHISCGGLFTVCLTVDGQLISFGCGKHGRLGIGQDTDQLSPTFVKFPSQVIVKTVSCGSWHAAAITEDQSLYIWGYAKACGLSSTSEFPQGVLSPALVPKFSMSDVVGVACGHNYTLAWTSDGRAFSYGCGRHGVLGHGSEDDIPTPKMIDSLSEQNVVFMDAGYAYCGAVTKDGRVFMFGKGSYGALGLGVKNTKNALVPTEVSSLDGEDVAEISCSVGEHHGHTLAVTRAGAVFSWGDGYKGKLGLGDQESRYTPIRIPQSSFLDESIIHVASGGIHSTANSREGHIFTWGCGSDGRLGHPEAKGHRYLFRSDIPRKVDFFNSDQFVAHAKCSYYHTVALVTKSDPLRKAEPRTEETCR